VQKKFWLGQHDKIFKEILKMGQYFHYKNFFSIHNIE